MSDAPRHDQDVVDAVPVPPPSPVRPPSQPREPQPVPHSAGEPPSWFPDVEAGRPEAPNPMTWVTPASVTDPRTPGPRWDRDPGEPAQPGFVSRLGVVVLAVAIVIAAGVVALGMVARGQAAAPAAPVTVTATPTASPSANQTTDSSTKGGARVLPTPSASDGTAAQLPDMTFDPIPDPKPDGGVDARLVANSLYELAAPDLHQCPPPATPSEEQQWRDTVRKQWKCVHEAWVPAFEQMGWPTDMPAVHFYPGKGSKSDCGYFEAPAFYCARNGGTVFFGGGHLKMAGEWDLSINEMVNHEYSHHVQALAGISEAWHGEQGDRAELVRRSELQAVCWSAMMTARNDAVGFDRDDYSSWSDRLQSMRESTEHGQRASLIHWGTRGLYAERIGECNTWTVAGSEVR